MAHAAEVIVPVWTPETIEDLARAKAKKYGVNQDHFVETMRAESRGFIDPGIQSGAHMRDGSREPSFGVCQFFMPSVLKSATGETVTKDMALDPERCLDAAAYNFSIGNANQWTEWRKRYGN